MLDTLVQHGLTKNATWHYTELATSCNPSSIDLALHGRSGREGRIADLAERDDRVISHDPNHLQIYLLNHTRSGKVVSLHNQSILTKAAYLIRIIHWIVSQGVHLIYALSGSGFCSSSTAVSTSDPICRHEIAKIRFTSSLSLATSAVASSSKSFVWL